MEMEMDSEDSRHNNIAAAAAAAAAAVVVVGPHICHKCGWPFPNSHPSARHRRAHKKICGTIEGYTQLKFSDSDEDPKMISGGSFRSEDELFSDAVTEFSDSGFSPDTLGTGSDNAQLLRLDATADIIKPLNCPMESGEVYIPEVTEIAPNTTLEETVIEKPTIANSCVNGSPSDSPTTKFEKLADTPKEKINEKVGDGEKQCLMTCLDQETIVKGNEEDTDKEEKGERDEVFSHLLSVANDLPVVYQPEMMLEDFKDHKTVKSSLPLTLGSAEVIKSVEIDSEDVVYQDCGANMDSWAEMNAMEDGVKQDGREKKLIMEIPCEGEAYISEFKVTSNENEKIQIPPPPYKNESPRESLSDYTAIHPSGGVKKEILVPENSGTRVVEDLPVAVNIADCVSVSGDLPRRDVAGEHERGRIVIFDMAQTKIIGVKVEENCQIGTTHLDSVPDSTAVEFQKIPHEYSHVVIQEPQSRLESEIVVAETVGAGVIGSESNYSAGTEESQKISERPIFTEPTQHIDTHQITDADASEKISGTPIINEPRQRLIDSGLAHHTADAAFSEKKLENLILEEAVASDIDSGSTTRSYGTTCEEGHSSGDGDIKDASEPNQEEGDEKIPKLHYGVAAVDISADTNSQTDSLEGNWGSVSGVSIQTDAPAYNGAEALPSSESQAPTKSEKSNSQMPNTGPEGLHLDKSDVFEPPSFMTLVQPEAVASEIRTAHNTQEPNTGKEDLQAGWFPSITNVVNVSEGRKKNEEVIAKVTSWSTGKQHAPLKNLLGEGNDKTKLETQKDETKGTTVNSVMGSEASADEAAKRDTGTEWNSPARYPTNNKKGKRKVNSKLSWAPFICCSSVD